MVIFFPLAQCHNSMTGYILSNRKRRCGESTRNPLRMGMFSPNRPSPLVLGSLRLPVKKGRLFNETFFLGTWKLVTSKTILNISAFHCSSYGFPSFFVLSVGIWRIQSPGDRTGRYRGLLHVEHDSKLIYVTSLWPFALWVVASRYFKNIGRKQF